jgi:hypothetical protein
VSRTRKDLTGQVFGKLKVIGHVPDRKDEAGKRFWNCECSCGRIVVVRGDNLKSGHSTQCIQCCYDNRRKRKRKVVKKVDLGRK